MMHTVPSTCKYENLFEIEVIVPNNCLLLGFPIVKGSIVECLVTWKPGDLKRRTIKSGTEAPHTCIIYFLAPEHRGGKSCRKSGTPPHRTNMHTCTCTCTWKFYNHTEFKVWKVFLFKLDTEQTWHTWLHVHTITLHQGGKFQYRHTIQVRTFYCRSNREMCGLQKVACHCTSFQGDKKRFKAQPSYPKLRSQLCRSVS
jgi:hypothetical protein